MYDDLFDEPARSPRTPDDASEWDWDRDRYDDLPTDEDAQKPGFFDHVDDLRTRAIRCFVALVVAFLGSLFIGRYVVDFIELPARRALEKYARDLAEAERKKLLASGLAD